MPKIISFALGFFAFLWLTNTFSQEVVDNLQSTIIDATLIKDANAIIRSEELDIEIKSTTSVSIKTRRIITVLNKKGNQYVNAYEYYNGESKQIKKLEAEIYDSLGKQVKRYKKGDFHDRSIFEGLMGDTRIKYIDYTPTAYPYTVIYTSEIESSNSAFFRLWSPISNYGLSIEKSSYKVHNPSLMPIRVNEKNLDRFSIQSSKTKSSYTYQITNVPAILSEVYSPSETELFPSVKFSLNTFSLEGVKGEATDWNTLGKWIYNNLLIGKDDNLPDNTIQEINTIVSTLNTKEEKVKAIYEYVQNKTRYISVQLGIGGWMPYIASDVDRLGYGDCKGLTNYTKALLKTQGIDSYYTIVHAGENKKDIDSSFASLQGNHAILNVPNDIGNDIWLECTSQTLPFNFIGAFTDDRNVFVIKPEGGIIKRTKKYKTDENILYTKASVTLSKSKEMSANLVRTSRGLEYYWNYSITDKAPKDQKLSYKEDWSYINNLDIVSLNLLNNKDSIQLTEEIRVSSPAYLKKAGTRFLFAPNIFNRNRHELPIYIDRKSALIIPRGNVQIDEYMINLPDGYYLENLPKKKTIETVFGFYSYELKKNSESQLQLNRYLKIIDGTFSKDQYESFRVFMSKITKIDNSKIVLKPL